MRAFVLISVLVAAVAESEEKKPIVTTDIIHGTGELIYDLYDGIYSKFFAHHVAKHGDTVMKALEPVKKQLPEDPIHEVCLKVGCKKHEVLKHMDSAADLAATAANTIQAKAYELHEPLTQGTHKVVDGFESAMPSHRGLIPRTPGNLLLFCLWIVFVIYAGSKISFFFIRLALRVSIFCLKLACCCGCCGYCFRSPKVKEEKPSNGKAQKNGKATNGKAAVEPKKKK